MMALNALKNYERTNLQLTENGAWNVCAMLFWYNLKISKNAYMRQRIVKQTQNRVCVWKFQSAKSQYKKQHAKMK